MQLDNQNFADHLSAAAQDGIISIEQANALTGFIAGRIAPVRGGNTGVPGPDDERFRLIGGFNDIFVAIGIGLVYWALMGFLGSGALASPVVLLAISAAIAWVLAEVFTARMRLALPSIILSLIFTASAGAMIAAMVTPDLNTINLWDTMAFASSRVALTPGIAFIAAAALHFWRFRVPIDVALITAGVIATVLVFIGLTNMSFLMSHLNLTILIVGLAVFALAMTFDMSDPQRRTWRSDAAFWLHMMAAPAIVHPAVFGLAGGPSQFTGIAPGSAPMILALFALFSIIAIIIDRRALIVSALAYAGGAIGYYLNDDLFGGTGFTLLALGAVILALSAGWRGIRRFVLPLLPLGAFKERLPPA